MMNTKELLQHCTIDNALSYNDIINMSSDELSKILFVCWHDANYKGGCNEESLRCYEEGITDIGYQMINPNMYILEWCDNSGEQNIDINSLDQKIHQIGDGEWDYGLYKIK